MSFGNGMKREGHLGNSVEVQDRTCAQVQYSVFAVIVENPRNAMSAARQVEIMNRTGFAKG